MLDPRIAGRTTLLLAAMALAGTSAAPAQAGDAGKLPLKLTAFATSSGQAEQLRPGSLRAATIDITIDRWSTDAERAALVRALREKDTAGLLAALKATEAVGSVSTPNTNPWSIRYAAQIPGEDGTRRILVATDRPITGFETSRGASSVNYPFTVIELRLNRHDEGEGRLALATRIVPSADGQRVELQDYSAERVALETVRPRLE